MCFQGMLVLGHTMPRLGCGELRRRRNVGAEMLRHTLWRQMSPVFLWLPSSTHEPNSNVYKTVARRGVTGIQTPRSFLAKKASSGREIPLRKASRMTFYIEVAPKYARTLRYMHLSMYARHLNCRLIELDQPTDHCFLYTINFKCLSVPNDTY